VSVSPPEQMNRDLVFCVASAPLGADTAVREYVAGCSVEVTSATGYTPVSRSAAPIAFEATETATPVSHGTVNRHLVELDQKGILMLRQVQCGCGYLACGDSADQVISLVMAHVATDHPDLAETETPDDIRSWIELVPD
jgi:hypothetical protein